MQIAVTHKNADFDALASIIAATLLYPDAVAICSLNVNPNVQQFLSLHKTAFRLILRPEIQPETIQRLIITDCNQWHRLDHFKKLQQQPNLEIHLWDHHSGPSDIEAQWSCVEQSGAVITLFVRALQRQQRAISPLEATLFLLGLYEDTGQLTFASTTPEDIRSAAFLLEQGADLAIVADFLHLAYGEAQKDVLFKLIRNGELIDIQGKKIALALIQLDRYIELASVVQLYGRIVDAQAQFIVFANADGTFFIIGRSGDKDIDASLVLRQFGGGGHWGAASASIDDPTRSGQELRQTILDALTEIKPGGALVADMMSFPVTSISPNTPMHQVRAIMEEQQIRGLVVEENDCLVGIVVLWDLKKLTLRKQWNSPVKAFMNRTVTTIAPDVRASEAAALMVREDIGHLPVVQNKKVIGIITRTDIINYLYGMVPG